MKKCFCLIVILISSVLTAYSQVVEQSEEKLKAWGDQGNGTYINPILNSDYSDPDVIRVGDRYYMVASDFHFLGMQVLVSDDMVNWRLLSQVYSQFNFPEWNTSGRYGGGSWAPSIRYHNGKFWIFFCTPNEGLFMTNASDPAGPWSPLFNVSQVQNWEDPCPFWDKDGQAYLGHSVLGGGPIIIHKMSSDGTKLLDTGVTVYTGPVAEGTKIHKRNGYYYLSIPEGGVTGGWQTILRSRNIYGPYEKKVVLEQGCTSINGPHQGAIVDTPDGEWFFFHFQLCNPLGRVVHLQPMSWKDEWPVIGVDRDMNGIGEPVFVWTKPRNTSEFKIETPQTDDDFNSDKLALQWQFNHNPVDSAWSLMEQKGMLTMHALKANDFMHARNTLTQKTMGYEGTATVKINFQNIAEGMRAGMVCMGMKNALIGVMRQDNQNMVYFEWNGQITQSLPLTHKKEIYFRLQMDASINKYVFSYSYDNKNFVSLGKPVSMQFGNWKGVRVGLYCYNVNSSDGKACFDVFTYQHDGPKGL